MLNTQPINGALRFFSIGLVLLSSQMVSAQGLQNYFEDGGQIRGHAGIDALGSNAFGEQVNGFTGAVSFSQLDLSLKGNSSLAVEIRRRLVTGIVTRAENGSEPPRWFADWELDIPHIKTMAAWNEGWQLWVQSPGNAENYKRCSYFGEDLLPARSSQGPWVYPGAPVLEVHSPSGNGGQLLAAMGTYPSPTDGRAYPILTKSGWQFSCISLAPGSGQKGEGFLALDPNGTKYQFDWLVRRKVADAYRQPSNGARGTGMDANAELEPSFRNAADLDAYRSKVTPQVAISGSVAVPRAEYRLLPTLVTDRFGNWVRYNWAADAPWKLNSIAASDGRTVAINYSGQLIESITDGVRTWQYVYEGQYSPTDAAKTRLKAVNLPDLSSWQFSGPSLQYSTPPLMSCQDPASVGPAGTPKRMVHPSGLQAEFSLRFQRGPFDVGYCYHSTGGVIGRSLYAGYSLASKRTSGPGVPAGEWVYSAYTSGVDSASYLITDPEGRRIRHTYGIQHLGNKGKLLKTEEGLDASGNSALRTTTFRYRSDQGQSFAPRFGAADGRTSDGGSETLNQPLDLVQVNVQGVTFSREVLTFDSLARPLSDALSNSLGLNRTNVTAYADNTNLWVLGQIDTITSNGQTVVDNDYFPSNAMLRSSSKFGVFQHSFTYNTDGTLASRTDGRNYTTYFNNYKRGLPQSVSYPDGSGEFAVVNDLGLVTSVTGAAGYTTGYGYDSMGRLASISPPSGWAATSLSFEQVWTPEYGLPAGHWRQTISKGNARTITYYDAFWRPVMTRSFDAGDEANTRKVTVKSYDADGRVTFESYPQRDFSTVAVTSPGKRSSYDALGRLKQQDADSELGTLSSTTEYLSGFQVRHTNPRGKQSTQTLWALDNPSESQLSAISVPAGGGLPGGMSVSIARDAFGKPTSITRSGNGASVTRSYVYDSGQRLCKTVEPEVGATIQDYDAAGNIAWRAPGVGYTGLGSCDQASVPAAARISHGYDAVNQLTSTSYGDGSPSVTRAYWPDGKLKTVSTGSGDSWSYSYNALRLLDNETFSYAGQSFTFSWGYDGNGSLSSLSYPTGGPVITYLPNALGEPSHVGGYATAVKFHPNGAVSDYTLGNGIAHSLTQNLRGLPLVNRDAGVMQDQYSYDANGNVTAIADQQEAVFSRAMTYDDLDRLWTANAPGVWGNASYSYDAVDNLRTATVGSRSSTLNYDGSNKLSSIVTNGSQANYGYDARGNISSKGGQSFAFDLGNRLSSASLGGGYTYDGHGRRFRVASSDGSTRLQLYSQAGQILWATSSGGPRPAGSTAYIYLGGKQIAEWVSAGNQTQYVHTDALGSPVAHTNASGGLMNRTRFEPYGFTAAGTKPGPNTSSIGFTGHVNDPETDLVYMQQRYYDPIAGRFLSVDPIVTDANTGKGFGLYTYVENNPYNRIDPDGREQQFLVGGGIFRSWLWSRGAESVRKGV